MVLRPGSGRGLRVVTVGIVEVHEGVIGAFVGVELESLPQPGQLGIELVPVL